MSAVCTWPLPESDPNSVGTVCEQPAVDGHSVAAQTKSKLPWVLQLQPSLLWIADAALW